MNNIAEKITLLDDDIHLTVEPHHLSDIEAELIAQHIKRSKINARRRQLYAEKKHTIAA